MADNPLTSLLALLAGGNIEEKHKQAIDALKRDTLKLESELPPKSASSTEIVEFFAKQVNNRCEEREKSINVDKADLALWRARVAMLEVSTDTQRHHRDATVELLDHKEKLLQLQSYEVTVHRKVINILLSLYN